MNRKLLSGIGKNVRDSDLAVWLLHFFQTKKMSSGTSAGGGGAGGALNLMSCVKEVSPSPKFYHFQHRNPSKMDKSHFTGEHNVDPLPKGQVLYFP